MKALNKLKKVFFSNKARVDTFEDGEIAFIYHGRNESIFVKTYKFHLKHWIGLSSLYMGAVSFVFAVWVCYGK